jgi:hypothetical protein
VVTLLRFGFGQEHLFVRVDAVQPLDDLLAAGREFSLKFLTPPGVRFSVRRQLGRLTGSFWDRHEAEGARAAHWVERGPAAAAVAAATVLELAVPLADLGLSPGAPVSFFLAVYAAGDVETERHPAHQPIEVETPDAEFEARHWRA